MTLVLTKPSIDTPLRSLVKSANLTRIENEWNGLQAALSSVVARKNSLTTIVNTTTETDLVPGGMTIAGNALGTHGSAVFYAWGDYFNNSAASKQVNFKLKLAGTQIATGTGYTTNPSASRFAWVIRARIQNSNATNAQSIDVMQGTPASVVSVVSATFGAPTSIDSTSSMAVTLTATHLVADPLSETTCYGAFLEIFP